MQSPDADDLLRQVRAVARAAGAIYRDLTDNDPHLDAAIRHAPLLFLGAAAGAGGIAGWWLGRRTRLPEPEPEPESLWSQLPLARFDALIPAVSERVREVLPEVTVSPALREAGLHWLHNVLEVESEPNAIDGMSPVARGLRTLLGHVATQLSASQDVRLDDPEEEA